MFIKLTSVENEDFYISIDQITVFTRYICENLSKKLLGAKSHVCLKPGAMSEDVETMGVKESPEEIMQLIKEAKNGNDL